MNLLTPQQLADISESLDALPRIASSVAAYKRVLLYQHDHHATPEPRESHDPIPPELAAAILKQLRDYRAQNGGLAGEQSNS